MTNEEIIIRLREMKVSRTYEVLARELDVKFRTLVRWIATGKIGNSWALILNARFKRLDEIRRQNETTNEFVHEN
jgi:hypothetical protein